MWYWYSDWPNLSQFPPPPPQLTFCADSRSWSLAPPCYHNGLTSTFSLEQVGWMLVWIVIDWWNSLSFVLRSYLLLDCVLTNNSTSVKEAHIELQVIVTMTNTVITIDYLASKSKCRPLYNCEVHVATENQQNKGARDHHLCLLQHHSLPIYLRNTK